MKKTCKKTQSQIEITGSNTVFPLVIAELQTSATPLGIHIEVSASLY